MEEQGPASEGSHLNGIQRRGHKRTKGAVCALKMWGLPFPKGTGAERTTLKHEEMDKDPG